MACNNMKSDESPPFLGIVLDSLTEGVFCIDRDRTITIWNRAAERITGFSAADVIGSSCNDNVINRIDEQCATLCERDCPLAETLTNGKKREERVFFHHRNGHRLPVMLRVAPVKNDEGLITGAIETFTDSTTDSSTQEKISHLQKLALLDPLTRIGNRRYTEKIIRDRLEETRRFGWSFGCLFVDIDFFKKVNDASGHIAGDRLLRMVATTLNRGLRPFDFVGRWGGDEFVAAVVNVDRRQLDGVAERCRLVVERTLFENGGVPIKTTVSIGSTIGRPGDTVNSLLRRADKLMYRSKASGRNCCTGDSPLEPADRALVREI
jgi:diguanylate cyclase (GGDEF)-like protein/PAS domain S-box-containing protein